jgi:hypothetical protein
MRLCSEPTLSPRKRVYCNRGLGFRHLHFHVVLIASAHFLRMYVIKLRTGKHLRPIE